MKKQVKLNRGCLDNIHGTIPVLNNSRCKMPTFNKQRWNGYAFQFRVHDCIRGFIHSIFHHDFLPYFYGTNIVFDQEVYRIDKNADKTIKYNWRLCSPNEQQEYDSGNGSIETSVISYKHFHLPSYQEKSIDIGRLSICIQYKVQIMYSTSKEVSPYITIAEFTLKDRDEFYAQIVIPVLLAIAVSLVGGIVGWFLRGGQ
jgi:hypothetical protein